MAISKHPSYSGHGSGVTDELDELLDDDDWSQRTYTGFATADEFDDDELELQ